MIKATNDENITNMDKKIYYSKRLANLKKI